MRNYPINTYVFERYRKDNKHCFHFGATETSTGNVCSLDYGIFITGIDIANSPERDISFLSVPGRNGDLIVDNKRWKNIDVIYHCAILDDFDRRFDLFKKDLYKFSGYRKLTDSFYPYHFRIGVLRNGIPVVPVKKNDAGTFDITFNCKPQRFFASDPTTTLTKSGVKFNTRSDFPSRPLITVYGNGPGTLTVGDITVDILKLDDQITLDCDLMNAYRQVGDAPVENKNADIFAPEFPELSGGDDVISWTGGITHVDIKPRGWAL